MTTDPFTDAARAEADRKYGDQTIAVGWKAIFLDAADWARTYLAAHDARVCRDAAREALGGLAAHIDSRSSWLAGTEMHSPKARDVLDYRDTHYPETED